MENFPQCATCGTTQQLLRCAKCKSIFYCSTAHQHVDWPKHKQSCRMLAKQKNDNRMQHLQQAVAATTLNNTNNQPSMPTTSNNIHIGQPHWSTPTNEVGIIGFGLIDGNESAEVDPSVLTAVSPITDMMGKHENGDIYNHSSNMVNENNHIPVSDTGGTGNGTNLMQNSTTLCMQPHYHNVNQRLLSPQYHQQQQQLTHNQLQSPQIQSTHTQYAQATNFPTHNRQLHYEKSISCQVGSGGGVDENAFGNANERRYDDLCRNIINDMNQYGLSVVDDFLGVEKGLQILNEVHRMYSAGVFKDGQLVNNLREEELRTIRGDKITWVKGVEPGCANVGYLINQIDAVICRANTMKNNGQLGNYNIKERTKAMVACYPGSGSHYVVHVDNPNKDGRVITAIYYLNVNWDTERSGGVLRIFPEHGNSVADIEPKFDRLIFFWSDRRNPHEVQPSHRTRYAITVWYFDANEREAALNRIKNNKNNAKLTADIKTTTNANNTIGTMSMASAANIPDNHSTITFTNPQINTTNATSTPTTALKSTVSTPTPTLPTTSADTKTVTNDNSNALISNSKCGSANNLPANTTEQHTNSNNTMLANTSEICT